MRRPRRLSDEQRSAAQALADELGWPVDDDDDLADLSELAEAMAYRAPDPEAQT